MSKLNGNDPAHPEIDRNNTVFINGVECYPLKGGLTVRQLLAKDFMANLLSVSTDCDSDHVREVAKEVATLAFELADAFIEVNNQLEK